MNQRLNLAPADVTSRDVWPAVNRLSRGDVEKVLEWGGYATYDHETTQELRECLVQCVVDGEIVLECVVLS